MSHHHQPHENQDPEHDDGVAGDAPLPELPALLSSTFTTNFDLRKGSAPSTSTAFGLSRERRASMEGLERPKLNPASDLPHKTSLDGLDDAFSPRMEEQIIKLAHEVRDVLLAEPTRMPKFLFYVATGSILMNIVCGLVGLSLAFRIWAT